jgi:hypothetical protein
MNLSIPLRLSSREQNTILFEVEGIDFLEVSIAIPFGRILVGDFIFKFLIEDNSISVRTKFNLDLFMSGLVRKKSVTRVLARPSEIIIPWV